MRVLRLVFSEHAAGEMVHCRANIKHKCQRERPNWGGKETRRPGETRPRRTAKAGNQGRLFLATEGGSISQALSLLKNMSA